MKTMLLACAACLFSTAAFAEDVQVTLTGVEPRGGEILATLQTQNDFMQPRGSYNAVIPAPAAAGDVTVTFANVAPGAYAFSAMHDANGDRQMQREDSGRPLEGWAMHNGASLRARPTFEDVKIDIGADGANLTEPMIYPQH